MKKLNSNLHRAKKAKQDEFYTQLADIENELKHYRGHFRGKVVYLNCDDHRASMFFKYFELNFEFLGLKKLIATHYEADKPSYKLEMEADVNGDGKIDGMDIVETKLKGNGDFRSPEAVEMLKECDIVVSNPPFSLFREYIAQIMEHGKKFLVVGSLNAVTYKEIFKHIKNNELWIGTQRVQKFLLPDGTYKAVGCYWYTNLEHNKRNEEMFLVAKYDAKEYPKYDNYEAINIDKTKYIPADYDGVMGVPVTFLEKYNPNQFEILDGIGRYSMLTGPTKETKGTYLTKINDKPKYARVIIKRK